jgi:hypothetical protein
LELTVLALDTRNEHVHDGEIVVKGVAGQGAVDRIQVVEVRRPFIPSVVVEIVWAIAVMDRLIHVEVVCLTGSVSRRVRKTAQRTVGEAAGGQ